MHQKPLIMMASFWWNSANTYTILLAVWECCADLQYTRPDNERRRSSVSCFITGAINTSHVMRAGCRSAPTVIVLQQQNTFNYKVQRESWLLRSNFSENLRLPHASTVLWLVPSKNTQHGREPVAPRPTWITDWPLCTLFFSNQCFWYCSSLDKACFLGV